MKLIKLTKQDFAALGNWRKREQQLMHLHRLIRKGQPKTFNLSAQQLNLFVQAKLKY
ncbi:hypothetical protein M3M39_00405 [Fructilactobacillus hinvesii]|uniref:ENTH domain-containing protein n=1 Tax=Fructilactobacillus hinvesii TaxID=2940300 RepID=A0ABY5BS98_9LACO|nr:hypothetical protein [Fructilactobacillus hinvesii]USS87985.1 hypothetical protein M3M39_00405 [Fructilactobacillus hinvesii]